MIDIIEPQPGETLLDLGQRDGLDAQLLLSRIPEGGMAYGIAATAEDSDAVFYAAKAAGIRPSVEVMVVDLRAAPTPELPLPDGEIDLVVAEDVFSPIAEKAPLLREVARVLVPGGRLVVADVVAENRVTVEARGEAGHSADSTSIASALTVADWERLLTDAGFLRVAIELIEPVAEGIHDAVVRATRR